MSERLRGKEVSIDFRKFHIDITRDLTWVHSVLLPSLKTHSLSETLRREQTKKKKTSQKKPTCGLVCLLKHLSLRLSSFPRNITFIYLLTSTPSRRAAITKTLMIDSRRTKHPALSGHFACSCTAFSAVNVCGPAILSKSHTVILALCGGE